MIALARARSRFAAAMFEFLSERPSSEHAFPSPTVSALVPDESRTGQQRLSAFLHGMNAPWVGRIRAMRVSMAEGPLGREYKRLTMRFLVGRSGSFRLGRLSWRTVGSGFQ